MSIKDRIEDWTLASAKRLAKRFRDNRVSFIQDEEVIEVIRQQRNREEYILYRKYINDPDIRIQCIVGLAMRSYEQDARRIKELTDDLFDKYGGQGVHVARAVQIGVLTDLIMELMPEARSREALGGIITRLLGNVDEHFCFVKNTDDVNTRVEDIYVRVTANQPDVFIISGSRAAIGKAEEIAIVANARLADYSISFQTRDRIKAIIALTKELYT